MEPTLSSDAAAAICKHMNEDHADAVAAYARTFGHIAGATAAQIVELDGQAMQLEVVADAERIMTRIVFDHVLVDSDDARVTLITMAQQAR